MNEKENIKLDTCLRPPTKRMVEKLKECLEKQSANGDVIPCLPEEMKSSLPGLYKRGFITTRMEIVSKKKQLCIYITPSGKNFLMGLDDKVKN